MYSQHIKSQQMIFLSSFFFFLNKIRSHYQREIQQLFSNTWKREGERERSSREKCIPSFTIIVLEVGTTSSWLRCPTYLSTKHISWLPEGWKVINYCSWIHDSSYQNYQIYQDGKRDGSKYTHKMLNVTSRINATHIKYKVQHRRQIH